MSMGLFAQNNESNNQYPITNSEASKQKYTFGDFFDALDLPTVLGVGITPNGIEGATFNSAMRLGWRHHKNYGTLSISLTTPIATPMTRYSCRAPISATAKFGITRLV
jgi:hypothetical protein